ncbi:MAG: leucine-rich repeat domain-containing protein, partial [Croceivirga sp.]
MLQKILLLPLLLFSLVTSAQTIIPDANFEQFLVDQGIDTNGLTGDILNADAAAVTNLNVTRNDITDFTGLEAFVNLITLNAGTNQFPTLPLNTLTVLEELEFQNNDALNALDVSQNIALRVLDIGSLFSGLAPHPPITDLDLSNNINLESLDLFLFINLSSLVLPNTSTLENIDIYRLGDPTLDFSNLDGLIDLRVRFSEVNTDITLPNTRTVLENIDIQGIIITDIDISEFISLVNVTFNSTYVETLILPSTNTLRRLDVQHHNLSNLPLTFASMPNLTDLIIKYNDAIPLIVDISSNFELEEIDLSYNDMAAIDVSQNIKCTDLDVTGNELTNLDVTTNIDLEELRAGSNQLPSIDVTRNTLLERVTLNNNLLPNLDVTQNTLLRSLSIDFNLFTTTGLDLTQNTELNYLSASNNQIESLDISNNLKMVSIVLSHNLFTGNDILEELFIAKTNYFGVSASNIIDVSHNQLSGPIPDFASLVGTSANYFRLRFNDNAFEFGDFENQHDRYVNFLSQTNTFGSSELPIMTEYLYAPQANVNEIENFDRNAGESITLTTTVRGSQNHYKWFKDGVEILDAPDSPELVIYDLDSCDEGVYHSEITSDLVYFENSSPPGTGNKNLLLVRNDITLTVNTTKTCVILSNPVNNANDVPINTGIEWVDNPSACGYKVSVGTTSGGVDVVNDLDVGDVNIYNFGANLNPNQQYFVTITPYYEDGDFGGCSEESFTTNSSLSVPQCTSLSSPMNNANNVAINIPSIQWNPSNGADSYTVTISGTDGTNDIMGFATSDTFYNLPNDFNNGETVTVTIIPNNDEGSATGCLSETFSTIALAPNIPICTSLIEPINNAINVEEDISNIFWEPVADATGYRISIDGSLSNSNDITDQIVNGTSYPIANNFASGEMVTVTIMPFGTDGEAVGCTSENFTIITDNSQPVCTMLTGPMANSTDV